MEGTGSITGSGDGNTSELLLVNFTAYGMANFSISANGCVAITGGSITSAGGANINANAAKAIYQTSIVAPGTFTLSAANLTDTTTSYLVGNNFTTTNNSLSQESVDKILTDVLAAVVRLSWPGGTVTITGGSASPGATGLAAIATLTGTYGYTVTTN
jgi:hypothetical protein